VAGAALVFAATFIIINGLQSDFPCLLDAQDVDHRAGARARLAVDVPRHAGDPHPGRAAGGSTLVLGTLVGLALNLLFRIGLRQTVSMTVQPGAVDVEALEEFLEENGGHWGARRDVIARAKFNLAQSIDTLAYSGVTSGPLRVEASFDEFSLDVRVSYDGAALELPATRPSSDEVLDSEEGERKLAGYLLRRSADRVTETHKGGRSTIVFHFDH
jgi:NCS2 family nucleobase:cation symporter-2